MSDANAAPTAATEPAPPAANSDTQIECICGREQQVKKSQEEQQ